MKIKFSSACLTIPTSDYMVNSVDKLDIMKISFMGANAGVSKELYTREFVDKLLMNLANTSLDELGVRAKLKEN